MLTNDLLNRDNNICTLNKIALSIQVQNILRIDIEREIKEV